MGIRKKNKELIYRRCPTAWQDNGLPLKGPMPWARVDPKKRRGCQAVMLIMYNRGGQEIGARKREGTCLKTSSNLMIKNITDDSNMGVGGLKADK